MRWYLNASLCIFQNLSLLDLVFAGFGCSISRKTLLSELTSVTFFLKWTSHWQITVICMYEAETMFHTPSLQPLVSLTCLIIY